ncbi:ATP-binding protein [Enterobacteriaceae bacterium 89]|nr:ATP-binding protein [Enterobacteriaceae bacterium 89]
MIENSLEKQLLKQELEEVKSNIERIISSYRHTWDIYTEILQNAADAILEQFGTLESGVVSLDVDTYSRTVIIKDNGVGLCENDISKILVNGKSLKRKRKSGKFGFMGFGFTFVSFQTNYLKIESVKDRVYSSRTYNNLFDFVFSSGPLPNSEEELNGKEGCFCDEDNWTKITLKFPAEFPEQTVEQSIFSAFEMAKNRETFITVLRTKTIIGILDKVFDNNSGMFLFSLVIDGEYIDITTGYLTTREIVSKILLSEQQFYSLEQYNPIVNATNLLPQSSQDQARRAVLLDSIIKDVEIGTRNKIKANFHISATSKSLINKFNETISIPDFDFEVQHGLWLSICGMPIGVCLDSFDHSNYLPFTVICDVQDDSIRRELDAGRKGISAYRMRQITDKALDLLREHDFIKYRRYVVAGDTRISNPLYEPKTELLKLKNEKKYYNIDLINKYLPPFEEQEVISLFIELLSKNVIKGYSLNVLSGYQVYDGLFSYELDFSQDCLYTQSNTLGITKAVFDSNGSSLKKDILVEFKINRNKLYSDLDKNKKDISHIDLLVCWDVDLNSRVDLQKSKGDILQDKDITTNVFYGVTHYLFGGGRQQPLPIIELKTVLKQSFSLDC